MIVDPKDSLGDLTAVDSTADLDEDDRDELLDEAAQGENLTTDESTSNVGEIDAIGRAAGMVIPDDRSFRGIDVVDRRDDHRWELDPASKEDDPDEV
jgi:Family of unknown function (DUF6335)